MVNIGRHGMVAELRTITVEHRGLTDARDVIDYKGTLYEPCGRCIPMLSGSWPSMVHGGVCFQCSGNGHVGATTEKAIIAKLKRRIGDRVRAEAKIAAWETARAEAAAVWLAANPALAEALAVWLAENTTTDVDGYESTPVPWLADLARQAPSAGLSDAETRQVTEALAEEAEKAAVRAERAANARYAGDAGDKITFTGKVTTVRTIDGHYGTSRMIIADGTGDDTGIRVKTFTTAGWAWDTEEGDDVTLTGTIKSLEEVSVTEQDRYGAPPAVTVLTRPKRAA